MVIHSLLQLYLDGPRDKIFYVFSSKSAKNLKLNSSFLGEKVKYIDKKNYHDIKLSQKNAFIQALKENKTPFREIIIKKFNEDTLGKLFLLFIFETIILSKMIKVNPFDQPAVERVKILTKQFLTSKNFQKLKEKDLIVICDVGAYGMSLSSNYNVRLKPAEILIKGFKINLIKKRQKLKDLM